MILKYGSLVLILSRFKWLADLEDWLTTALLPVVYWHQHLHKSQNSQARERYRKAWTGANQALQAHPFTAVLPDSEIQRWLILLC